MKTAFYDLSKPHRTSTYDVLTWLMQIQMMGYECVNFGTRGWISRKWDIDEARRRFKNYMMPAVHLAGLKCTIDATPSGDDIGTNLMSAFPALIAKHGRWRGFFAPKPAREKYTVTLRQTFHNSYKNSNVDLWRRFAREIGAYVIEDYAVKRITMEDRINLYAGARMNFGVPNGPMSLIWYTNYPLCMVCDPETTAKSFGGHGIKVGDRMPWLLPQHRLIWKRPDMDVLMGAFFALEREREIGALCPA